MRGTTDYEIRKSFPDMIIGFDANDRTLLEWYKYDENLRNLIKYVVDNQDITMDCIRKNNGEPAAFLYFTKISFLRDLAAKAEAYT